MSATRVTVVAQMAYTAQFRGAVVVCTRTLRVLLLAGANFREF